MRELVPPLNRGSSSGREERQSRDECRPVRGLGFSARDDQTSKVTRAMTDLIKCPECRAEIPLTEVISHQIEEQLAAQLARELADKERAFEAEQAKREAAFAAESAERETALRREFEEAQAKREAELERRAAANVATELADLDARVKEQDAQIRAAHERELELRKQKRKLDDEKAKLDLEFARRLDEERTKIALEARQAANEAHELVLRQKDLQTEQLKRQIKELQESAEQTRAGLIGEAQEREIEDVLRERFRADVIEPVKSGVRGADVLQRVFSPRGDCCGQILWESKRAQNWSSTWVAKLKADQAAAGADVAVLVCQALPSDVRHMEIVDGIWVVRYAYVSCIAQALREALIGIAHARSIDANRNDSLHEIYDYLTSSDFNRRVRTMVEAFIEMKADLDSERRSMERMWNKRAKQLDALALNTAGMYGELEALVGTALPPIEMLELPPPVPLRSAG
jgi:hypothetical protein